MTLKDGFLSISKICSLFPLVQVASDAFHVQ